MNIPHSPARYRNRSGGGRAGRGPDAPLAGRGKNSGQPIEGQPVTNRNTRVFCCGGPSPGAALHPKMTFVFAYPRFLNLPWWSRRVYYAIYRLTECHHDWRTMNESTQTRMELARTSALPPGRERGHFFFARLAWHWWWAWLLFTTKKKWLVPCLAIGVSLLVGTFDYFTLHPIAFSIFYLPAIMVVTWSCGRSAGYGLSALCALLWLIADAAPIASFFDSTTGIMLWNAFVRLVIFFLVTYLLANVRTRQSNLQHQVKEQTDKLMTEVFRREGAERELPEVVRFEQQRLAQALHDGLGADLAGLGMHAKLLAQSLCRTGSPGAREAGELDSRLGDAAVQLRNMARALFKGIDGEERICSQLSALVEQSRSLFHVECRATLPPCMPELGRNCCQDCWKVVHSSVPAGERRGSPSQLRHHLYCIAQESIRNAVMHGQASRVDVQFALKDTHLLLEISDNGRGFSGGGATSGIGLRSMELRAAALGGMLEIDSKPNGGCAVRCRIPYHLQGQSST